MTEALEVEMIDTSINGRWNLKLPKHRAERPEWPWWEAIRLNDIFRTVPRGGLIIDVGSEEADMSALFASWGLKVAMIEPNPRVWPNAKAIWEANNLRLPLATFVGFASNEGRDIRNAHNAHNRAIWPDCADGQVIGDHGFLTPWEYPEVPRVSLDFFCGYHGLAPQAITIDVEGSELDVLQGAKSIMLAHRPVIWCSIHHCILERLGLSAAHVYAFMDEMGYSKTLLDDGHELHCRFDHR